MRGIKNEIVIRGINRIIYEYIKLLQKHNKKKSYSLILMFHDIIIDTNSKGKNSMNDFSVTFERFKEIVEWISDQGYQFVSLEKLLNSSEGDKLCVISFDDVFQGVYDYAFPYLKENNIPFILYIASGLLNQGNYLSVANVNEMSESPLCTVGAHTVNHIMTRFASQETLEQELKESKLFLENILKKEVCHFAFPYGSPRACSYFDLKYIKSCGYKSAVTTFQYHVGKRFKNWKYLLPRYDASRVDFFEII